VFDFFTPGRPNTDCGDDGLAAEEIFAAGINDAKNGKARSLGRVLRAGSWSSCGLQALFVPGDCGKSLWYSASRALSRHLRNTPRKACPAWDAIFPGVIPRSARTTA
jgi:hypothetical protein